MSSSFDVAAHVPFLSNSSFDVQKATTIAICFTIFIVIFQVVRVLSADNGKDGIPWGLPYMKYLPRWASGFLHSHFSLQIIRESFKKHGERPFWLVRHDVDIMLLPPRLVDELAGLPNETASNILALGYDLVGQWSGLSILNDDDLHSRVVHRRITPSLAELSTAFEEEVADAVASTFPQNESEWVKVNPYPLMMRVASRVFSRIVVGPEMCRDRRWEEFAANFTENVFHSITFMRYFPPWMYPVLRYAVPSVGRSLKNIKQAEDLLAPIFAKALKAEALKTEKDPINRAADHCLKWLPELATENEQDPVKMVHAQILLALGAVHTSLFAELNMLYDLMSNPDLIDVIRSEITDVEKQGWSYNSYSQLHKLDSILRESQGATPPFLIGLRRIVKQDYTFTNGTKVKQGQYVCVPTYSIQNDLSTDKDDSFDGLRSYNKRVKENALRSTKYQFSTTESTVLGFGHGRTACPGRFAASVALKVVFVKLLSEYDFKFPGGSTERPPPCRANEVVSPDPSVEILVRRRAAVSAPF